LSNDGDFYIKKAKTVTLEEERELYEYVRNIISQVRTAGDIALHDLSMKFDKVDRQNLRISAEEIEAMKVVPTELRMMIDFAIQQVRNFARKQMDCYCNFEVENFPGAVLGQRIIPISSVGCYIPGGRYPLVSSPIMCIVPAKVAGVERVVACTPLRKTGTIDAAVLYSIVTSGADEVYAVGGAQAIAAMAYGTGTIQSVDKIVGPGNVYVNEAKRQVYGRVGIDLLAGPSEVVVLADETAKPELIAIDLLAQAEHDAQARAILITNSRRIAEESNREVLRQSERLATAQVAKQSWEERGEIILAETMDRAIQVANEISPEHIEVHTKSPREVLPKLKNYGSLFLGEWSPVVLGDQVVGTNHVLPTLRAARYSGGLFVGSFLKTVTYQSVARESSKRLGDMAAKLSRYEGLDAHATSAEARLKARADV
jgi:histidinol dehydrogenase/sulfopropanediol 3-dehydrogenase